MRCDEEHAIGGGESGCRRHSEGPSRSSMPTRGAGGS
jgi:hypothetical protein